MLARSASASTGRSPAAAAAAALRRRFSSRGRCERQEAGPLQLRLDAHLQRGASELNNWVDCAAREVGPSGLGGARCRAELSGSRRGLDGSIAQEAAAVAQAHELGHRGNA